MLRTALLRFCSRKAFGLLLVCAYIQPLPLFATNVILPSPAEMQQALSPADDGFSLSLAESAGVIVQAQDPHLANFISLAALRQFYGHHAYQAQWHDPQRLAGLIHELESLTHDGLNPASYDVDGLRVLLTLLQGADAHTTWQMCDELWVTTVYLQALADLHHGRLRAAVVEPWWRFDEGISQPQAGPAAALVAAAAADLNDLPGVFQRARPAMARYHALRASHTRLSSVLLHGTSWPQLPSGPSLRPGERDPRVRILRQLLHLHAALQNADVHLPVESLSSSAFNDDFYDEALVAEVTRFQEAHKLETDGIVGRATAAVLNVTPEQRLSQIRADLERTRWLAREIASVTAPRFVLVDIPSASIHYFRNGEEVWHARTQVGQPKRPTPLLRSEITHFTVNPTWTVPPTILRNDKLPQIRADIGYLARNNMRVLDRQGKELDPYAIDWQQPGAIMLRQDAGPGNALGQVAIRFPNPFSVYLHDTPSQRLFGRDQRAVSSGCVRVEHALELTQLLLEEDGYHEPDTLQNTLESRKTRNLRLLTPVPILLAYSGVAENQAATGTRPDIYGRDAKLIRALERVASIRPAPVSSCAPKF